MHTKYLVPKVPNKVYFQAMVRDQHIEFEKAQLIEIDYTKNPKEKTLFEIEHTHNGRSEFTFTPKSDIFQYKYKLRVFRDSKTYLDFDFTEIHPMYTTMMTMGFDVQGHMFVTIRNNKRYNPEGKNLKFTIRNNEQTVFEKDITILGDAYSFAILKQDLYAKSPNGGVLYVYLQDKGNFDQGCEQDQIMLSRKIFLMPTSKIDFIIAPSHESYNPKALVEFAILMNTFEPNDGEKFYASLTVTDVSSYLRVPKFKQGPTLPSMVYLENEVT